MSATAASYRRIGTRVQPRDRLTIATTMYREMGMQHWFGQAEAEARDVV